MSEINKNKLDQFFSDSMEHFNDVPSDNVWEGISDRLDEDDDRPVFWWRKGLLMVLPLLVIGLIGAYYFTSNRPGSKKYEKSIVSIEQKPNSSPSEKDQIQDFNPSEIQNQNENEAQLITDQSTSTKKELSKPDVPSESKIVKPQNNKAYTPSQRTISYPSSVAVEDTESESSISQARSIAAIPVFDQSNINADKTIEHKTPTVENKASKGSTTDQTKIDALKSLESLNHKLDFPELARSFALDHERNLNAPPIIITKEDHFSKYRIGLSGRFANTFVSDNNMFNGNESYGLRQEYYLSDRLSITNAIHFNIQHYDIKPTSTAIEPVVVLRYTSRSFDDSGGVQKIESNSEYLDFSLGLKYKLGARLFGFSTFVNPAFVGQIYSPQTFNFLDLQGNMQVRHNKNIVMYLGSANLNLGIERQLNKNLHLQVSIWGEQSFIPIGLQREKIKTIGISTSLLFGK